MKSMTNTQAYIKPFKDPISVFNFFSPVPFFAFQASTPYLISHTICILFFDANSQPKSFVRKPLKGPNRVSQMSAMSELEFLKACAALLLLFIAILGGQGAL